MIKRRNQFLFFLALSAIWMLVIFWKSAEPYHEQDIKPFLSEQIPPQVLETLLPNIEFYYDGELVTYHKPYGMFEFFIRKGGHVAEYFILAALFWGLFTATTLRLHRAFLLAFALAVLYAASDEFHQTFVPNRTGHAIDVVVDASGALLALLLLLFWTVRRHKKASPSL